MPAPLRLASPGDVISAARFNEVITALNALAQISGVFPIEVQQDAAGVRIGLANQCKAWLFRIASEREDPLRTDDRVPYYQATRLRLDGDEKYAPQSPDDVTLYDPLAKDVPTKILPAGSWVLAAFDADAGRWQIVRDPYAGPTIVRFRLTETLSLGGHAQAKIRRYDRDAGAYVDGDAITVKDYFGALSDPGEWQAYTGWYGFAAKLPDSDEYQVLYLEHVAGYIAFTLTGSFSAGTAAATFDSYWNGRTIAGNGFVHDRQTLYANAAAGDKGIAAWDPAQEEYVVIDMGRGAVDLQLFYLNDDLAKEGDAPATLRRWNDELEVWQATGADETVFDSSRLGPAKQYDVGVCFKSPASGRYEIIALPGAGGVRIERFRLTSALTLGGTAPAVIERWDSETAEYVDGDAITVIDWYGAVGRRGKFQGRIDNRGYCVNLGDHDEWQILDMECQALFVEVTLTDDMSGGNAACSFDVWWQGQDTGAAASVFDPLEIYPHAKAGDKFLAAWDDHAARYKIVDGPTAATIRWARTYTKHTLVGESPSSEHFVECQAVDNLAGDGFDDESEHFHVRLPSPSSAQDPNVQSGQIIGYMLDGTGERICVTDYLDQARGQLQIWSGAADHVPHGWSLCDGSNGTPDLRGKFVVAASPGDETNFDGDGNGTDVGTSGGKQKHTHDPHQPVPVSSTNLTVNTTISGNQFVSGDTTAEAVTIVTNTSFGLLAFGYTEPESLHVELVLPSVGETSLEVTVIDPATGTAGHDDHKHHAPNKKLNIVTSKGSEHGVTTTPYSDSPDADLTSGMVDGTGASVSYSHEAIVSPNPHTHTLSNDGDSGGITPNPHFHRVSIPVTGSINVTATSPAHSHKIFAQVQGNLTANSTINPSSHNHFTPTLSHAQQYHIPPYYALAYIMRVN